MDKKSRWFVRGRLRTALLVAVCLAAIVALPALASAAPAFSTQYPADGSTLIASPPVIGANVLSSGVRLSKATMSISGGTLPGTVALRPSITQAGAASMGTWTASEVTNPKGLVVIKWTWTATPGPNVNCVISAIPPKLGVGTYDVAATATDANGATTAAGTWSFTVGTAATPKPVFGAVTPAAFTTTGTAPLISAAVTGATSANATIDNVSATGALAGDVFTLDPVTLTAGTHTVIVSATNAGGTSSKAWTFTSKTVQPADARCITCHASRASDPLMGPDCTWCHPAPKHGLMPSTSIGTVHDAMEASIRTESAVCVSCHGNDLQSVGSRLTAYGEVNVPAVSSDPVQEHKGCSCHTYGEDEPGTGACEDCHGAVGDPAAAYPYHVNYHDTLADTCVASGCHTGTFSDLHSTQQCTVCHTPTGTKACIDCHADRIDLGGNVIVHSYTTSAHTSADGAATVSGVRATTDWNMGDAWVNGEYLNPWYSYGPTCSECHSMVLDTEHGGSTACATCHTVAGTGAGDALKVGKWNPKTCTTAGCHSLSGIHVGGMDYSHSVAAAEQVAPRGCSASLLSLGALRTPCHYVDIVQEHNRSIAGYNASFARAITKRFSVSCEECHNSAKFAALNGSWDGTCDACHNDSHAIVGSARYDEVRAVHQAPSSFLGGQTLPDGTQLGGINSMDAHGPNRMGSWGRALNKPFGCAYSLCHTNAYGEAGMSGYYAANNCAGCHTPPDTTAPTGSILINGNAASTTNPAVTLTLSASDSGSGMSSGQMRFSNSSADIGTATWVTYATTASWTLTAGNGAKTVYAQFKDVAGNISSTYSDGIMLGAADATPPTGSILVAGGAASTNNPAVALTLSATDNPGGSGMSGGQMRFSNSSATIGSATWVTYATTASWTLTAGDGAKTVYVQYRDVVGNVSPTYSDGITLQTSAGTATIVFSWDGESEWTDLAVYNETTGVRVAGTTLSGSGSDLEWSVDVPSGQSYRLTAEGDWGADPDEYTGVLGAGQTYTWMY